MSKGAAITVAVLGSARVSRGTLEWSEGFEIGALLSDMGWRLLTGGYGGLMVAVAEGARSRGGHVIGLPMRAWAHLVPNPANEELAWCSTYGERLDRITAADVVVALPGGVGTLSEWAVGWAAAQTENRPYGVVLVGARWAKLVKSLRELLVASDEDYGLLAVAEQATDVPAKVREFLGVKRATNARG